MLMYIIILEVQMIHMYHKDNLIKDNSESNLQEKICGIPFHRLLKTHSSYLSERYETLLNWEKNVSLTYRPE